MKRFLFSLVFVLCVVAGWAQSKFIPASNPNIRYVGRLDFSDSQEVRFDWAGVYIQFTFRSTYCAVRMSDTGHNYYLVLVDNQPAKTIDVKSVVGYEQTLNSAGQTLDKSPKQAYDMTMLALTLNEC